jgi:hypothetical protein
MPDLTAIKRLPNGTDWIVYRDASVGMTRIVSCVCGAPLNGTSKYSGAPETLFATWSRILVPVLPPDSAFKPRRIAPQPLHTSGPAQTIVDEAYGLPAQNAAGDCDENTEWFHARG